MLLTLQIIDMKRNEQHRGDMKFAILVVDQS